MAGDANLASRTGYVSLWSFPHCNGFKSSVGLLFKSESAVSMEEAWLILRVWWQFMYSHFLSCQFSWCVLIIIKLVRIYQKNLQLLSNFLYSVLLQPSTMFEKQVVCICSSQPQKVDIQFDCSRKSILEAYTILARLSSDTVFLTLSSQCIGRINWQKTYCPPSSNYVV